MMDVGDASRVGRNLYAEQFARHTDIVTYLDAASATAYAKAYKARTFDLLGLVGGRQALDVGCGNGDDACAMARRVAPGGRVVGLDMNPAMIEEARRRAAATDAAAEFHVGDVHALDFPNGAFDGVRADRTMQHIADLPRALSEMTRVLRPGGRMVVFDPDWDTLVVDAPDRAATRAILLHRSDEFANSVIGRELPRLMRRAGLVRLEMIPCPFMSGDFPICDQLFGLKTYADKATAAGVVDPAAGDRWYESLADAWRSGDFFCALTAYIAVGQKG